MRLVLREAPYLIGKPDQKVFFSHERAHTNRDIDGSDLIQWHRKRCGKSEHAHSMQKEGLAGGQLPSNLFGVNAAWWQIMVLAFNLNRLMQIAAFPKTFRESKMKALRFHVIQMPGRVVHHARQVYVRVDKTCFDLYQSIRRKIVCVSNGLEECIANSS